VELAPEDLLFEEGDIYELQTMDGRVTSAMRSERGF